MSPPIDTDQRLQRCTTGVITAYDMFHTNENLQGSREGHRNQFAKYSYHAHMRHLQTGPAT